MQVLAMERENSGTLLNHGVENIRPGELEPILIQTVLFSRSCGGITRARSDAPL
jgi:hypothetical protein